MFYAHFVLAKKGPLARIWLAAHWDKKLTKAHVFETSIETSVEGILHPKVKMALRTSGHLLLGVVRIYSRKAHYLLADCNEAFVKIKMAFRLGMVDLPEDCREAAVNAITLKEVFHDFDDPVDISELDDVDIHAQLISNQTRLEEITMREDYDSLNLPQNDFEGFGDLEFNQDAAEQLRDGTRHSGRLSAVDLSTVDRTKDRFSLAEGFGGDITAGRDLFEGGIFDEAAAAVPLEPPPELPSISEDFEGPPSMVVSVGGGTSPGATHEPLAAPTLTREETLSFTLAPIETPTVRGVRGGGARRKRKLIVDQVKNLSGEQVKAQLTDTEDILTTLDLAPPSKQLMRWKETGGVDKLFVLPGRKFPSRRIIAIYQAHLKTNKVEEIEGISVVHNNDNQDATGLDNEAPPILSPSEPPTPAPPKSAKGEGSRGRKRKALEPIEQLRENSEAEMVNFSMTERELMAFNDLGGYQQPSSINMTTMDHEASADPQNQTTLDAPSLEMGDNSLLPQTPREGHQDYEASVKGQQNGNETSEQELVLNQRAVELYHQIKPKLEENSSISFSSMCNASSSRKEVAQKFYSMLVLKKAEAVELVQNKPFEEIVVTKGTQTLSMAL